MISAAATTASLYIAISSKEESTPQARFPFKLLGVQLLRGAARLLTGALLEGRHSRAALHWRLPRIAVGGHGSGRRRNHDGPGGRRNASRRVQLVGRSASPLAGALRVRG